MVVAPQKIGDAIEAIINELCWLGRHSFGQMKSTISSKTSTEKIKLDYGRGAIAGFAEI
jgi:hypothetical protein